MNGIKRYTKGEELCNSVSHGAGVVLGIVAGWILLSAAFESKNPWAIGSVVAYLFGMLSSYTSSTLYHACTHAGKKELFRKLDHSAIYLHIAGTYVPFTLVTLRESGAWGWSLFTFVTLAAVIGVIASFKNLKAHSNLETICFVMMGATILVAFGPLIQTLSPTGLIHTLYWIIAGGASYITGALFYSWIGKRYMHSVFHLFVLGGSFCHIYAIYLIL